VFARKNYFYPDLPKGYQISQYEQPLATKGSLSFLLPIAAFRRPVIVRLHVEEDAGKSLHDRFPKATAVDLNRAGCRSSNRQPPRLPLPARGRARISRR